jgi:hypothetical protein
MIVFLPLCYFVIMWASCGRVFGAVIQGLGNKSGKPA